MFLVILGYYEVLNTSKYVVENRTKYDLKSGGERFNIFKKDIKDYINRWDLLKKR